MLVSEIPALRDHWYPVAYSSGRGNGPLAFRLFGGDFVLWSSDERWYAAPAGNGDAGPASAGAVAAEKYGLVWVCVGDPGPGIPAHREADDPAYTIVHEMFEEWSVSAPRAIDNALDVSHLAFVHRATVGTSDAPRMQSLEVGVDGDRLWCKASYVSRVTELQKRNTGISSDYTTRISDVELLAPLTFRGALMYPENGLVHVLYKTATPVDDHSILFCQFVARNDHPDASRRAGLAELDRAVQAEDRRLLEQMQADFPLDVATEVHTSTDRVTVEYRRLLARLARMGGNTVRPDAEWSIFAQARVASAAQ